jgi:aryl-alcohol dehydrogenase-like predicted oxidoreductase
VGQVSAGPRREPKIRIAEPAERGPPPESSTDPTTAGDRPAVADFERLEFPLGVLGALAVPSLQRCMLSGMKRRAFGSSGLSVSAVGMGCMYLSIHDRPSEDDAVRTLHAAFDAGVTLLDTADVYCLDHRDIGHNERLIARALRERKDAAVVVATKGGCERPNGSWTRNGRPSHLRRACEASLAALGIERIGVYQLHAPDPSVPIAESVGELARLRADGKISHVGLSNVTVREIDEARAIVPIVSVQNRWNPGHRAPESDGVLSYCTEHRIAFLPYSPFGGASGAKGLASTGRLAAEAKRRGMSPHRLVLSWMLAKSPAVVAIPGARRVASIVDSAMAADGELSADDARAVEAAFG